RLSILSGICVLMSTVACNPGDAPIDASGMAFAQLGRVTIQLAHDHDTNARRVHTEAVFARWRGLAENTVGAVLALPGFGIGELKAGECRVFDQAAAMGEAAGGRVDIQLLDAGDVVVETANRLVSLQGRRYPDVLPTLNGFVYQAPTELEAS